jgi:pimeloyl-ACP methyl ester carboxylesterase
MQMASYKRLLAAATILAMTLQGCCLIEDPIPAGIVAIPTIDATDHLVSVGGINFHYAEYKGDGPVVLMLHGFGSSTYTWEKVAPLLQKKGHHVYTLDMKGFGWTDKPVDGAYDPRTLKEEVLAWMDAVGIKKTTLVGNSLGGAISVLIALENPDRVEQMILTDPAGYPQVKPLIIRLADLPLASDALKLVFSRWVVKWNLGEVFHNPDRVTADRVMAYYERLHSQGGLEAQVAVARSLDFEKFGSFIRRIPEVKAKTLIIWGKDDRWVPLENARKYRSDLKNSVLALIADCGHVPQEEYPEATAKLILDFIGGRLSEDTELNTL